jgi:hypothetical protein
MTNRQPQKGFYYHYKHDPSGEWNNYLYEVLNVGHHTEMDGLEKSAMVVYRPLYPEAGVYKIGKHWDVRPLTMFMEQVEKDGKKQDRFTYITDPDLVAKCQALAEEMYS